MIKSKIIYGCESRGDAHSAYLTRWTLLETKPGSLYLHQFHRSDSVEDHDHPWPFWSLILWPGYWEVTPQGRQRRRPLSLVYRPAIWRHRVQLLTGTCRRCSGTGVDCLHESRECTACRGFCRIEIPCWTLLWVGPKVREWGFFTRAGWQNWREYFREKGC